MKKDLELFSHKHVDNKAQKTIFLLHGTGGNADDFLFLDNILEQQFNLVGIQGNIQENGMNRFFKRNGAGVFDQVNIKVETSKLNKFLIAWREKNKLSTENSIFLGYSNGANMLLAMFFYYPEAVKNLVLLHPMLPFEPEITTKYPDYTVYFSFGSRDPMISPEDSLKATQVLTNLGVKLTIKEYGSGHGVTDREIEEIAEYLEMLA